MLEAGLVDQCEPSGSIRDRAAAFSRGSVRPYVDRASAILAREPARDHPPIRRRPQHGDRPGILRPRSQRAKHRRQRWAQPAHGRRRGQANQLYFAPRVRREPLGTVSKTRAPITSMSSKGPESVSTTVPNSSRTTGACHLRYSRPSSAPWPPNTAGSCRSRSSLASVA